MKKLLCKIFGHKLHWLLVCWDGKPPRWKQKCKICKETIADLPAYEVDKETICKCCKNKLTHPIKISDFYFHISVPCVQCINFSNFIQKSK